MSNRSRPDIYCDVLDHERRLSARRKREKLMSYLLVGMIAVESAGFVLGKHEFSRWLLVVGLCLIAATFLGRSMLYRAQLLELARRHREVLNE